MLFSKQRRINELIADNDAQGITDNIKILRPGAVEDMYVKVYIAHPYTGDISIELESPAGTRVTLWAKTGKPGKDINTVFDGKVFKKMIGEKAKGNWKLIVKDEAPKDEGFLCSWTIGFNLAQKGSEVFLTDTKGKHLKSKHHCHETGKIESIKGSIELLHPTSNKLQIDLIAPSGKSLTVFDKTKTKKRNLKKAFPKNILKDFVGEKANGVWTLNVTDETNAEKARLKKWSLDIAVN